MRRHVKASSAGSTEPSDKRRRWSLLATLAIALCALGSGASFASAAAPSVLKTDDATEVGYTTAKVSGEVEPDPAFETDCRFEYIPVADFGSHSEVKRLTVTRDSGIFQFFFPKTGHYTTLSYDAPAATAQSALEGLEDVGPGNVTVTGGPGSPSGSTPYLIAFGGALANKEVGMGIYGNDPSIELVTVTKGHTEGWEGAGQAPCEPENPLTTPSTTEVSANLTGLANGTEYRLRLVASNQDGSDSKEAADTFTTKAVTSPTVSIDPVTTFTDTTAHFVGHITPGGTDPAFDTSWHFQCKPACPGLSGGTVSADESPHAVEVDATGLEPNTNYEVKLVASNAGGSNSAQTSLQTPAVAPSVLTIPAFILEGGTSALVGGRVNAHNSASTWWIEYGTTTGYGQSLPTSKDGAEGSGGQLQFQTQELTGLAPDTIYHFRVSAKNAEGEAHGEDLTFATPPPPSPVSCSNAAFRTGPSAALPDCRAYENVTPMSLLGTSVRPPAVSGRIGVVAESGEAVLWSTYANLPGVDSSGTLDTYLAKRTSSGWSSTLASPPGHLSPWDTPYLMSVTPNLERTIWNVPNAFNPEDPDPTGPEGLYTDLYRDEADGSAVWLNRGSDMAPAPNGAYDEFAGASADALTVFFQTPRQYEPDATGGLYLRSGQTTTPIRNENGQQIAVQVNGRAPSVSADGSVAAFYSASGVYVYKQSLGHAGIVAAEGSTIIGLSRDGSRLLLASRNPLTPDDEDSAGDIYEYDVSAGGFKRLSGASAGPGSGNGKADAEPVLASPDGSVVYFTSTEQLDGSKGVSGARNLYRAEGGAIHYAMTLLGSDSRPSEGLSPWQPRLIRDGGKLLFESPDRLTAYDNAGHTEIYAYDRADNTTVCASCRPNGEVPSGDATFGEDPLFEKTTGFVAGSHFFFQSTDQLLPQDVNDKADVYEFNPSSSMTSLISTGESPSPSYALGGSPDGRDIFFTSVDSLRPNDKNVGTRKLFDARIGGGFAEPPPPAVCEGEGCRGAGSVKPAEVAPATQSFSGPGNPRKPRKPRKHPHKSHKKNKSHKKKHQSKSPKRAANSNGRTGR